MMKSNWINYSIKDGIVFGIYEPNVTIDLEQAKEILTDRLTFQNGKDYPFVFHINGINMLKEARLYMGKEGTKGISMGAFIVKNQIEKVMFNIFMIVEKPPVPTRGFTTEQAAINWIHKQLLMKQA